MVFFRKGKSPFWRLGSIFTLWALSRLSIYPYRVVFGRFVSQTLKVTILDVQMASRVELRPLGVTSVLEILILGVFGCFMLFLETKSGHLGFQNSVQEFLASGHYLSSQNTCIGWILAIFYHFSDIVSRHIGFPNGVCGRLSAFRHNPGSGNTHNGDIWPFYLFFWSWKSPSWISKCCSGSIFGPRVSSHLSKYPY